MLDDGSLLGIVKGRYVEKVGLDSTLIWRLMIGAHHDLDVDEDGRVFVLTEHMGSLTRDGVEIPIVDNGIASIAPDGTFLGEVSLLGALGHRIPEGRLEEIRSAGGDVHTEDVLHSNSIEILRRDVEGLGRRGQVLVAVRELDLIAVVDLGSRETVFEFGPGTLDRPHHPSVAPNGNLLVFDNGMSRGFSRVIEVDPKTKQIVWEYRAEPPARFFSYDRGACQSLSNGNVLITESNRGRVFEVTRDGTIVWEFFNPDVNSKERSRAAIYRMERIELQRLARLPLAGSGTSSRADAEVQDPGEG
jgi:hypothetical protein